MILPGGKHDLHSVNVRSVSSMGGSVEIRLDKVGGPLLARIPIGKSADWEVLKTKMVSVASGVHDLVVAPGENSDVELDWISFE